MSMRNAGGIDDAGLNPVASADPIPFPESKLSRSIELSGQLRDALASNDIADPPTAVGAAGKDGPGNSVETLAPIPAVLSPMYEVEEWILALAETEELVSEAQKLAFLAELSEALQTGKAKRDQVAGFIKNLELSASGILSSEIQRLQTRKRIAENTAKRLRQYVLWIIEGMGPGPDGKLRKLEGDRFTFATSKAQPKLEITDEAAIPREYCTVVLQVSAAWYRQYSQVLAALGLEHPSRGLIVDEAKVREYLEGAPAECGWCCGSGVLHQDQALESRADGSLPCQNCGGSGVIPPSVPGARLVTDRNSLVLR